MVSVVIPNHSAPLRLTRHRLVDPPSPETSTPALSVSHSSSSVAIELENSVKPLLSELKGSALHNKE